MEAISQTPRIDIEFETYDDVQIVEESQSNSKRKKTSDVWNYFSVHIIGGKSSVKCNHCDVCYTYEGSSYGTSTLKRHLLVCKKKPKFGDVGVMFVDHEGKMKARGNNINKKICRDWMTKITIGHSLPLKWIEYKYMRNFLKYFSPDIHFITRNTLASDVLKMYESEKEKLKFTLKNIRGMVCLTSDIWTACTSAGYICLSAHFVDEKWKLNIKLLTFCDMPPPHSDPEMAQKIYDCLVDWKIDTKVFCLTLDNASSNNSMARMLKSRLLLQNSLLCNGEYFHVRCCAHILNLIVQDGMNVDSVSLEKIRGSIKYVKGSEARMIKFQECAKKGALK